MLQERAVRVFTLADPLSERSIAAARASPAGTASPVAGTPRRTYRRAPGPTPSDPGTASGCGGRPTSYFELRRLGRVVLPPIGSRTLVEPRICASAAVLRALARPVICASVLMYDAYTACGSDTRTSSASSAASCQTAGATRVGSRRVRAPPPCARPLPGSNAVSGVTPGAPSAWSRRRSRRSAAATLRAGPPRPYPRVAEFDVQPAAPCRYPSLRSHRSPPYPPRLPLSRPHPTLPRPEHLGGPAPATVRYDAASRLDHRRVRPRQCTANRGGAVPPRLTVRIWIRHPSTVGRIRYRVSAGRLDSAPSVPYRA